MNLLRYPGLDRQRRQRHRWLTGMVGGVVGWLLASASTPWAEAQVESLHQEHQQLQARMAQRQQHVQARQRQQTQDHLAQQQRAHLRQVAQEHADWLRLHRAVHLVSQDGALQWVSLQLSQDQLALQGQSTSLQVMNLARERLSQTLARPVHLTNATMVPVHVPAAPPDTMPAGLALARQGVIGMPEVVQVAFVWTTPWPSSPGYAGGVQSTPPERAAIAGVP